MRKIALLAIVVMIGIAFGGCSIEKGGPKKIKDLSFTVMKDEDIPETLKNEVEAKKETEFKMTYNDKEYLYIVRGYGKQETGGYSITINNLYLAENAIYFNSNLIGPSRDETISEAPSFPYIVVKMEYLEKNVVFE